MTAVEASDLPALHAFVRGLRKDLDAVVAGLSLSYSNGPIEGQHQGQDPEATDVRTRRLRAAAPAGHAHLARRHHLFCARAVRRTLPRLQRWGVPVDVGAVETARQPA